MNRQIARGYATQALCAIIGNDGVLYTQDFRGRKTPVVQFVRNGAAINPLACDTAAQARAILKAHRYLGIVMPVFFEAEMANI
jgi:hypothetical protein|nr:MAG TPA: hypothetical protein [Caudoviricetes sp.]